MFEKRDPTEQADGYASLRLDEVFGSDRGD